jgi:tricorn protease
LHARRYAFAAMLAMALLMSSLVVSAHDNEDVGLPRFPSVSPDGSEIVFSWGGNLWRVASHGGEAIPLTRHRQDDLHSSWSPDGEWITFASMRDGFMNLWRIRRDGTRLAQLTYFDRHVRNPGYALGSDGVPVITFSGLIEGDVYRDERSYVMDAEGGEHRRLHDAFGSEPRLSPDGRRIAFTRGGYYHSWNRRHYRGPDAMNVWVYDLEQGTYRAITRWHGDDGRAQWLDDHTLIFMSDREDDTVNLYRADIRADDAPVTRLTDFRGRDVQSFDVSRDGSTAILHVWDSLYRLDLTDPEAEPVRLSVRAGDDAHDAYQLRVVDRDVTEAALSPDGKVMAYVAYGRVYVRHMDSHSPTRAVTPGAHARHGDLAWSPDGLRLYFTSDADGTWSIYEARVALTRDDVRSLRPALMAATVPVGPSAPLAGPAATAHERSAPAQRMRLEPVRLIEDVRAATRGIEPEDPFAPVDPGLTGAPEPADPEPLPQPLREVPALPERVPDTDSTPENPERITADLDPSRWHDAVQFDVRAVVQTRHDDRGASPGPDGRALAFRRGRGDLVVRELATGTERVLVEGWDPSLHWRWSPDGRHIAYAQNDLDFSSNIYVVPADGSHVPVNVTRHPRNDVNPRWSTDGRVLTFISNRSGDSYDLYRIYLDAALENYSARELTDYYRNARRAAERARPLSTRHPTVNTAHRAEQPVLDLEDAWRRVKRVTAQPVNQFANDMTPAADRYVFNSGGEGLIVMNWDGSARRRLGPVGKVQHLTIGGDRVVYIVDGRVRVAKLDDGSVDQPDITDRIRIDLGQQSLQKYFETTRLIHERFYRTDMKGLDWPALVADYATLVQRARTASEFSDVVNRLMGELAASHVGVANPGPPSPLREPAGRLGIDHEPVVLADGGIGYRVTRVIPSGPAARATPPLRVDDVIVQINGERLDARTPMMRYLRGTVGQEVLLSVARSNGTRHIEYRTLLTPVDFAELARLRYDAFRDDSQRRVHALSAGRVGYIHIQAMNQTSLEGFQADLYAAAVGRDGLIIDVRNNGGGHTTDRILTSIMAPNHAYTLPAGVNPARSGHYPQDRLDAPRYTLPINMLANEKSFSNAEILAHAFKTLGRGTLIGQQTYGGVISTSVYSLIDGGTVQLPSRGWFLPDGTDMEHHGAIPDIVVEQTPMDEVEGRDRQLERAVADLLSRLDHVRPERGAAAMAPPRG